MEFNESTLEKLIEMEEISGFEEFLSALNISFETTNMTNEPLTSKPETIITILLCTVAFILNVFAICGTYNIPNGLTTHSKLIISLAVSDLLIVISVFAHLLSKVLHEPLNPFTATADERMSIACSFAFISSLNITAHLISLLNLLMMAVDHYLAIIKPYQYTFLLNKRNGIIIIVIMWCVALVGGFINFFTGIGSFKDNEKQKMNYCEYIMYNDFHGDYLVIACTFLSLLSIIFIYLRIYYEVRQMNKRLTLLTFNKEHNAKTLVTTLLIIGTFVLCWIPLFTFQIILLIQVHINRDAVIKTLKSLILANKYLYMLLLVNSICDPIIYAVRLKEVQLGYKRFCKSVCVKYSILGSRNFRRSSFLDSLHSRRKLTLTSESGERTISLMISENGLERDKDKFISEGEIDNTELV